VGIFLGIDGGGSKTSCVIGDEKNVLGSGKAGASNVARVGEERARKAISAALRAACAMANVAPTQIQRTCAGMAGGARPETAATVKRVIADLVSGKVQVVGDMVIALEAAFGEGPGIVVIAGTGSIVYGRNSSGRMARAGGWGPAVSDAGSGYWIGREAVAAALRSFDQGHTPPLLGRVISAWKVENHDQLVLAANASPPPDFAALLPVVLSAFDDGDPIARRVLAQAGLRLNSLTRIVIERLFTDEPARVAMSGGVFRNSALVREVFYNQLRSEFPDVAVNPEMIDPVNGALELARRGMQSS
jgi:glucosamine kinase